MLERFGDDPLTVDAALSGLAGREGAVLQRVMEAQEQTPQRAAVITTLAATIVKSAQDTAVQDLLQAVAEDKRPAWQRQALLAGAEAVLAGAAAAWVAPAARELPMPQRRPTLRPVVEADPEGRGHSPTSRRCCAGQRCRCGRAGAGGGRGRGGGGSVALSREPNAFVAMAGSRRGARPARQRTCSRA